MARKKPTVYLDTSFISAYWNESADVVLSSRRIITREWWRDERPFFAVFASSGTEQELRAGVYPRQSECLKMVRRIPYLQINKAILELAEEIRLHQLVPATKEGDALQMAIATVHEVDYHLTWNYAHLANPDAQDRLASLCRRLNMRVPSMVSPDTMPRVSLGQITRRKPR
jgi:hypothetical protein